MNANMLLVLVALAVGAFALGADSFIMIGMLSDIAADLGVSQSVAGQLVTVFSLCYALFAPLGATVSARLGGRRTLLAAMAIFTFGNVLCAVADTYATMLAGRMIAAFGAGAFLPVATATASALVGPQRRGVALSVIFGGMTIATAFGAPLGTWSGQMFGWRFAFMAIVAVGLLTMATLFLLVPKGEAASVASLKERLSAARNPRVLATLSVTFLVVMSEYVVFAYLSVVLGGSGAGILPLSMLIFGFGAILGNVITGFATDRFGPARVLLTAIAAQAACIATVVIFRQAPLVVLPVAFVWGVFSYMYLVPIQHRLLTLASEAGAFTVSLNSSVIYLAIAAGGAVGGLILAYASLSVLLVFSLCAGAAGFAVALAVFPARRPRGADRPLTPA
ncbi:MFS transporter [Rhizobiaceae bacterium BDR2-2]|uniref:MFS transporter n=1 Tax=Ectorhizobium quercum TaxID=2965071 RepID=A0AAE3N1L6_9HYPH|nr:MFS transporter [Ectorhizobium quercum]MCX8998496.1 MFS transporter [Ectorhizobium quercum]